MIDRDVIVTRDVTVNVTSDVTTVELAGQILRTKPVPQDERRECVQCHKSYRCPIRQRRFYCAACNPPRTEHARSDT